MTEGNVSLDSETEAAYYDIVDFAISHDNIQIAANGASVFIDAQGILADDTLVELSEYADWNSDNPEIVFADRGRLLGLRSGTANITVRYGDFTKEICASVLKEIDLTIVISRLNKGRVQFKKQKAATEIGKEMVTYPWTPTKNIRGWQNKFVFEAEKNYVGIPYSQTVNQVDKSGYLKAQSKSDFYADYTRMINKTEIIMPKYGNDSSGFVSFCWRIPRQTTDEFVKGIVNGTYTKVGSYDPKNPSISDLKAAYKSLVAGNAVVKSGHIVIQHFTRLKSSSFQAN